MIRLKTHIFWALLLLMPELAHSQFFNRQNGWKNYRKEVFGLVGFSNYLGELGGLDGLGKKYFILDLEISQSKLSYGGGFRYHFNQQMSGRFQGYYGKVSGSDQLTGNPERAYRNLSFESKIYEASIQYEYYILRTQPGHLYRIKGANGMKPQRWDLYGAAGISGFYFNPKADGVALQPLGTEGQGLPGGPPKKYSRIMIGFPVGFGVNMMLTNNIKIGLDFSYRFTFTDYLDDVSTFYYDNDKLRALAGDAAADQADKSPGGNPNWTVEGAIRGNPANNDAYLTAMASLTYVMKKKRRGPRRQGGAHPFQRRGKSSRF